MHNVTAIEELAKSFFKTDHQKEESPSPAVAEGKVSFDDMSRGLYFPPLQPGLLYE